MQRRHTSRVKAITIRRKRSTLIPLTITTVFFAVLGIAFFCHA